MSDQTTTIETPTPQPPARLPSAAEQIAAKRRELLAAYEKRKAEAKARASEAVPQPKEDKAADKPSAKGKGGNIRSAAAAGESSDAIAGRRARAYTKLQPKVAKEDAKAPEPFRFPKPPSEQEAEQDAAPEAEEKPEEEAEADAPDPEADDAPPSIDPLLAIRVVQSGLDLADVEGMKPEAIERLIGLVKAPKAPVSEPKEEAQSDIDLGSLNEIDPDAAKRIGSAFTAMQRQIAELRSRVENGGMGDPVEKYAVDNAAKYGWLLGEGRDADCTPAQVAARNSVRSGLELLTAGMKAAGQPVGANAARIVDQAMRLAHAEAITRHQMSVKSEALRNRKGQYIGTSRAGSAAREARQPANPRQRAIEKIAPMMKGWGY